MHDVLVVDGLQTLGNLARNLARTKHRQPTAAQHVAKRGPLQKLHHQIRAPIRQLPEVRDIDGIGMANQRRQLGFLLKAALRLGVLRLEQNLHRNRTVQDDVAALVDDAHAACGQALLNLVAVA